MNKTDLQPNQLLILCRAVTNPKPDRRQTRNWAAGETIPEGTLLVVRSSPETGVLRLAQAGGYDYTDTVDAYEPLFDALVEAAMPKNPANAWEALVKVGALSRTTHLSTDVFDVLVSAGRISLGEIEAAGEALVAANSDPTVIEGEEIATAALSKRLAQAMQE